MRCLGREGVRSTKEVDNIIKEEELESVKKMKSEKTFVYGIAPEFLKKGGEVIPKWFKLFSASEWRNSSRRLESILFTKEREKEMSEQGRQAPFFSQTELY